MSFVDAATAATEIKIGDAASLVANTTSTAFDEIAVDSGHTTSTPSDNELLVGSPYFLGHKVFFGLVGATAGTHAGPFYAF